MEPASSFQAFLPGWERKKQNKNKENKRKHALLLGIPSTLNKVSEPAAAAHRHHSTSSSQDRKGSKPPRSSLPDIHTPEPGRQKRRT
ncbi:hypothetical protein GN956_G7807 [Arapaima gigas]